MLKGLELRLKVKPVRIQSPCFSLYQTGQLNTIKYSNNSDCAYSVQLLY